MTVTYSSYTVSSTSGVYIGTDFYATGAILFLTDVAAKYLLINGQIVRSPDYVPPTTDPVQPVPVTETNTTVDISVDGTDQTVTVANLINLFPRLQPVPGPAGPQGEKGDQGPVGPQGPSISINGKNGALITLTKADIGLDQVADLSPANLPVSTATQAALALKLDASKVGIPGGTASLDAVSGTIPLNQIPGSDLPVSTAVATAIATAISNLIGGADAAYDTLKEIEQLLKGDDATLASLLAAVNARLIAANNLSDLKDPTAARGNLALGTLATQNSGSVQITGGVIDGAAIGSTTPATGKFTNLTATGTITGTLQGNAATATTAQTWATARTLSLGGFITGSVSLNGSQDVSITTVLNTIIPVASGGTGATTASAARANLSAAMSGANTDITSLNAPALGAATASTAAPGTSSTQVATTGFVAASFATTAFVLGQVATATPLMDGTAAVGTSTLFARQDHVHPSDTSRVAKAGDTLTGDLTVSKDQAAYWLSQTTGTFSGYAWRLFQATSDSAFNMQTWQAGAPVATTHSFKRDGSISTSQIGDVKTYIDGADANTLASATGTAIALAIALG